MIETTKPNKPRANITEIIPKLPKASVALDSERHWSGIIFGKMCFTQQRSGQ